VSPPIFILECQLVVTLASALLLVVVAGVVVAGIVVARIVVAGIVVARIVVTGIVVARIVVTGIVVAGIVVARIVVLRVSTVTAAVISSSPQDVLEAEEPDTNPILARSLASPPPAATVTAIVASKQSEQTSVCVLTIGLSFPSATGVVVVAVVVVVVAAAIKSPTENSTT